ncbi:MAG: hypothetical protein GIS02_03260 [Methanosarcinales archaeon]|uniref:Uncharacterized protein n=1 Tax=Candidatus Ethanoperedens thermophilum TaxID=2766897 RepID=A0A848D8Y0_9EURY|nr:hypothetical protein [Candidatus Ethanoperedens thermophilum]
MIAIVVGMLSILVPGAWYYSLSTNSDVLVLDETTLTVVLDSLPGDETDAVAISQETIINATGVPERAFNKYFKLKNVSRTEFQWLLLYNVTGNPDLSVFLVKRITPDEGFRISDDYIIGMVGVEYYNAHFKKKAFDSNTNIASYSFSYHYLIDKIGLTLWVKLGYDRSVIGKHVVTTAQEVKVSLEQAIEIGRTNGLSDTISGHPVVAGGVLCWRVVWKHTPTREDYDAHTIYGFDIHCTTGEVVGTHRYVLPKPPSIKATQITPLINNIGANDLKDGAVIQLRVMNSSKETFSLTKSFGKMVVKKGENENADITLWIDRELIVHALESGDVISYLKENAEEGQVGVELHKNVVILKKKGYMGLYEKLK